MAIAKIDAIKMTRAIREKNSERLSHLSRTERLAFYREQARLMNSKTAALIEPELLEPKQGVHELPASYGRSAGEKEDE